MLKNFKHFILTRFNLEVYNPAGSYAEKVGNPARWMDHRIKLFREYCLPSIKAQTCNNFTWIIAFDPDTPARVIGELDLPDMTFVCTCKPHEYIRQYEPFADWIITTRFDNDDQYRPQFVERVQVEAREVEEVIDIDYDIYDIHTGKRYHSLRVRPNSPFLSLVERWDKEPVTAMGRPHTVMPDLYPARKLETLATQIIHDRNVCNKITEFEL